MFPAGVAPAFRPSDDRVLLLDDGNLKPSPGVAPSTTSLQNPRLTRSASKANGRCSTS